MFLVFSTVLSVIFICSNIISQYFFRYKEISLLRTIISTNICCWKAQICVCNSKWFWYMTATFINGPVFNHTTVTVADISKIFHGCIGNLDVSYYIDGWSSGFELITLRIIWKGRLGVRLIIHKTTVIFAFFCHKVRRKI